MDAAGFFFHVNFLHNLEEEEQKRELRIRFKTLRDASNPFNIQENSFRKLYRLPKDLVLQVLIPEVTPHMHQNVRASYIPNHIRILVTLHFLVQGCYQTAAGKDFHCPVSQSMVSRIVKEVCTIVTEHMLPRYVKFPSTDDEVRTVKYKFQNKFGFPNVLGAVDGCHVAIISPPVDNPVQPAVAYLNRKGFYSVNMQGICDADLKFLAVNARYPGATHDAAIWAMSTINRYLQRKFQDGYTSQWLLGDSGYPLQPWLMTPIPDAPEDSPEGRYTKRHCQARNTIERAFGVLKQRFRCLLKHRVLHYSHEAAGRIIYTCCVLHNLCRDYNIEAEDDVDDDDNIHENGNIENREAEPDNWLTQGRRVRNRLIQDFDLEG